MRANEEVMSYFFIGEIFWGLWGSDFNQLSVDMRAAGPIVISFEVAKNRWIITPTNDE